MSAVKLGSIALGMYQTNCYFIYREDTGDAIVIDPADSGAYIYEMLTEKGLQVRGIFITHGHFDHIYGVKELKEKTGALVYAYETEAKILGNPDLNCSASVGRVETIEPDVYLTDGRSMEINGISFKVLHTPGHTEGSVSYYFEEQGFVVSGDTLFYGSVGRCDLPTGSMSALVRAVKDKLFILPDDTKVYPGHGEPTTIGYEKDYNPFLG